MKNVADSCPFCNTSLARANIVHRYTYWNLFIQSEEKRMKTKHSAGFLAPKRHISKLDGATDVEWAELKTIIKDAGKRLCDSVGLSYLYQETLGCNQGFEAGQTIEHVHMHILPVAREDPDELKVHGGIGGAFEALRRERLPDNQSPIEESETTIDKIAWIYIKDGKILSTLSKGKDKYYIPGGKREKYENDVETLTREIKEELSVELKLKTLKYYGAFMAQAHGKSEGVTVKMSCYTADYAGELKPDSEISEIVWLDYDDIDKISPVDKLIFQDLHDKGLIE